MSARLALPPLTLYQQHAKKSLVCPRSCLDRGQQHPPLRAYSVLACPRLSIKSSIKSTKCGGVRGRSTPPRARAFPFLPSNETPVLTGQKLHFAGHTAVGIYTTVTFVTSLSSSSSSSSLWASRSGKGVVALTPAAAVAAPDPAGNPNPALALRNSSMPRSAAKR